MKLLLMVLRSYKNVQVVKYVDAKLLYVEAGKSTRGKAGKSAEIQAGMFAL